jgi:hypothetical protein
MTGDRHRLQQRAADHAFGLLVEIGEIVAFHDSRLARRPNTPSWPGSTHFCPVVLSNTPGRLSHLVMAVRVAAIHVFGAASRVVDGLATPGHDVQTAPVGNGIFDRTEVGSTRPSTSARCIGRVGP